MANTIQHVCIYCRRRFRGKSLQYMSHIRKHRQWFHKYRFHQWKLNFGHGKNKYSKGKKKQCRQERRNRDKENCTQRDDSAAGRVETSPGPSTDNKSAVSPRRNKSHRNSDGLPSMVDSTRHSPSKNEKRHYKCAFCEKTFAGGSHLLLHERTHTGEKPHACRFCPKSFAQKGYLKIHERIHTGERPFKCTFCGKAFCTKEDLRRHERIHTGEKPYKCKVCARGFSQRSYRNKHEAIHSGDRPFASKPGLETLSPGVDISQLPELPPALFEALQVSGLLGTKVMTPEIIEKLKSMPGDQQQEFVDGLCIMRKKRKRKSKNSPDVDVWQLPEVPPALFEALQVAGLLGIMTPEIIEKLKNMPGDQQKEFINELSIMQKKGKIKSKKSKSTLIGLESLSTGVDVPYLPELPPALFEALQVAGLIGTNGFGLTPHIVEKLKSMPEDQQQKFIDGLSIIWRKRKPKYLCKFCNRDCRSSSQLRQHERTHTGEKPFQCQFCEKSFAQKGYARIHERIHTGERPFRCDVCSKAFAAKEDLRRHLRTHTGERPYKCEVCGKAFSQNSALIGHRKTHLNELTNLDYTSHSFIGSINSTVGEQGTPDFANYLGSDFYQSAKVMQMLAGEAGGFLPNLNQAADKGEREVDKIKDFNGEVAFGIPPKLEANFVSQSLSSNSMLNSLPFLPSLSSSSVDGRISTDTMDTVIKKGIHDIASKLLVSQRQDHNSNLQHQSNQVESSTPQNFAMQASEKQQSLIEDQIDEGISIVDHIRMQLSLPAEDPKESVETSHKEDHVDFDKKKKKINNLASQLSSKACKNNDFTLVDSDVFNKANKVNDVAAHLLAMNTSQDPTFQLDGLKTSESHVPANGHVFNKKIKINDLATQLLSTQLAQHTHVSDPNESNNLWMKDPIEQSSVSSDEARDLTFYNFDKSSSVPQSDSIYHRAAQLLQPQLRFSRSNCDDDVSNYNMKSFDEADENPHEPVGSGEGASCHAPPSDNISAEKEQDHFRSKKRNINGLASHLANLSAKKQNPDSNKSFVSNTSEVPPNSIQYSNIDRKSIDGIAAQLITTKSISQDKSNVVGAASSLNLEEEMLRRKQQGVSNDNVMCSKSIKPSLTSIFRPLQGM